MPIYEVDPISGLPMIYEGGDYRVLGALPSTRFSAIQDLQAALPLVPVSQWQDNVLRDFAAARRRNQQRSSSCTGYSTTTAARYTWKISEGADILFSPQFIYSLICGGVDKGASIHDAMLALQRYGVCLEQTVPELPQGCYQVSQLPQQAYEEAKHYRFDVYRASSYEELGTALHLGFLGITGVAVGNNLGQLDAEGCCPLPDRVIGGHALPLIGLKHGTRTGRVLFPFENSWTNHWGDDGFGALYQGHFNPQYGFPFDTFVIRLASVDPADPNPDPALLGASYVSK
jgi:hypothetical protein